MRHASSKNAFNNAGFVVAYKDSVMNDDPLDSIRIP
jgi:hypothetical protein